MLARLLAVPLFSRLAEALGVLALSSQKLDRRRGSSATPFFVAWVIVCACSGTKARRTCPGIIPGDTY